ncbi:hypothetical protein CC78DRAFT_540226 [Lojkania enalia]|uniref:DUF8021 domain-containing protein n=1 Tax=Lojkania enalia TaxID=147567 RepID=A0A9P4TN18_9PLEO|nr:hypothetical protein CC78DRAFT_540226 [Didymosphaeria enalia]
MQLSVLSLFIGLATQASALCSRTELQEITDAYIKAQVAGQPNLLPLADSISYFENDTLKDIAMGILVEPVTIDFNRSLYDTTQCATYTEVTAATNDHPYVISTRMLLTEGKISKIESAISDDGDWIFNATSFLSWTKRENWDPIPENKRDSRSVIKAAGDAYLDSWTNGSVKVPYGTPCARLEGGIYTGERNLTTNSCTMPVFPINFTITNRRYVIDPELGGLAIFNDFPFIDTTKPEGTPSTNFFRIEGGKIRYIHENTVCTAYNCGR